MAVRKNICVYAALLLVVAGALVGFIVYKNIYHRRNGSSLPIKALGNKENYSSTEEIPLVFFSLKSKDEINEAIAEQIKAVLASNQNIIHLNVNHILKELRVKYKGDIEELVSELSNKLKSLKIEPEIIPTKRVDLISQELGKFPPSYDIFRAMTVIDGVKHHEIFPDRQLITIYYDTRKLKVENIQHFLNQKFGLDFSVATEEVIQRKEKKMQDVSIPQEPQEQELEKEQGSEKGVGEGTEAEGIDDTQKEGDE